MMLGLALGVNRSYGAQTGAARLLGAAANGVAISFADNSMIVRDAGTPANNYVGTPAGKLAYSAPSAKYLKMASGLYVSASTIRSEYINGVGSGMPVEEARTNRVLHCRDLTNVAWVKVNATAAKDQTGIDGVANSASSLTATGANATCLQAIVNASAGRITSCFVKRITGSGTINLTQDAGTTWTVVTVTSEWTRVNVPTATLANPTVGLRIVTSGDAIAVDFVQEETGAAATSPIATTTVAVTRALDNISLASTLFPAITAGVTLYVKYRPYAVNTVAKYPVWLGASANDQVYLRYAASGTAAQGVVSQSAAVTLNISGGTTAAATWQKTAIGLALNDGAVYHNGASLGTDAATGLPASITSLLIGAVVGPNSHALAHIGEVLMVPRRMSNAEIDALTT